MIGNMDKIRQALMNWFHWTMGVIAIFAFAYPIFTPPSEENPAANAELTAPIIALCTAAILLAQAMNNQGMRIRRIPGIFIGVGSMASAYLWMAGAADAHPTDPILPIGLLFLFVLAAVATFVVPILTLEDRSKSSE